MKKHLSKLSFLIIGLSLAATVSYLNAWTGPTQTAPAGNVDAPVNLSSLSQIKLGGLSVASLLSTGAIGASQYCDALGQNCSTPPFGGSSVPAGTVAAFNLTTCPAGWIPADGTNGTRDLRGSFVRGYGTSTAGTAASGAFGVFQDDAFKSHTHTGSASGGNHTHPYTSGSQQANSNFQVGSGRWVGTPGVAATISSSGSHTHTVTITENTDGGGIETRPDNVALLFCQKDGTSSGGGSSSSDEFSSLKSINNISTFPNNVVCKNGNNSIILRIESVWGDSNPAQVIYKAQQDQYFLGYRKDNGHIASVSGYNIGTCPDQLSLDGRLTQ